MSRHYLAAAAGAALLMAAGAASAQAAFTPNAPGTWEVTVRATDVIPDNPHTIVTAAGADSGLKAHVGADVMPTVNFTYFFADKLAAELVLGTTHHDIRAIGGATNALVREQWVLPPVLALQYHPLPASRISPYVGAGVNYMMFYSGHDEPGFHTDLKNGFGWVLQGGTNVALNGPWYLNLDAKKIFFKTTATINAGALKSHIGLDPWVLSGGFGRKF